jgi:23S rRNA (adenine2503-C2)-methyltransferase
MKVNIKDMTIGELKHFCTGRSLKEYRAKQLFRWCWKKDASSFNDITTISKKQRKELEEIAELPRLQKEKVLKSKDGTRKYLFKLRDGEYIESVFIPAGKRKTVCISIQVGCPLNCSFCMTGKSGFKRNLSTWEICDQVRRIETDVKKRVTNVVLMGMGEPLLNYENVMNAIEILNSDIGMNIGARKITLSTAGIVPGIRKLAEEPIQVKLAVSLNAPTDKKRDKIMPINKKYNIESLFNALKYYYEIKKRRITFEYVLIKNFNDTERDAKNLAEITESIPCKINIIPFNNIDSCEFKRPNMKTIKKFIGYLYPIAQAVTLRESRGGDVYGACGQLRRRNVK